MSGTASILLSISIALLAGLLLSRLAKKMQLPAVTAYLVAGILIGPFMLGAFNIEGIGITHSQLSGLGIIADVALGFIAFSMGNEFRVGQLKEIGKRAMIIGIFQAIFTTIIVDGVLIKEGKLPAFRQEVALFNVRVSGHRLKYYTLNVYKHIITHFA